MECTTVDEVIIDFVRDNKCLYDKMDINFKNIIKKKEIWSKISENLKHLYQIDMSVEAIEKRWSSLRDMFVRENRKQKLPPSGSEYKPVKEWELYRNMMFLLPHIAHRRTKSSYIALNQSIGSCPNISSPKVNNLPFKEYVNLIDDQSLLSCDHNYSEPNKFFEDNEQLINENTVITIEPAVKRPASTMSTCSSTSSIQFSDSSTSSKNLESLPIFKPIKRILPETDKFAKRKKNKDDQIDRDLAEVSTEISTAIKTISSQLCDKKRKIDGYMSAVEEGLNYVPAKNKTQCLIKVLQIIQKYEERS